MKYSADPINGESEMMKLGRKQNIQSFVKHEKGVWLYLKRKAEAWRGLEMGSDLSLKQSLKLWAWEYILGIKQLQQTQGCFSL